MNDEQYIQHWNYFCSLTSRLEETKKYVYHGLSEDEFDTVRFIHGDVYSDVFKQIIVLASSEFEIIAKALCFEHGKRPSNIVGISKSILGFYPKIIDTQVVTEYCIITPLEEWKVINNKVEGLKWWNAYNTLKHNEDNSYKNATLENAIQSLSALYILHLYLMYDLIKNFQIAYLYPCIYFRSKYIGAPVSSGEGLLPDYGDKSPLDIAKEKYPAIYANDNNVHDVEKKNKMSQIKGKNTEPEEIV